MCIRDRDIRLRDDIDQHLHFVFHSVRIVLKQLVPVFRFNAHVIKVFINTFRGRDRFFIDIYEKL